MDGLFDAIERAGGYAALAAVLVFVVYWIVRRVLDDQRISAGEREASLLARTDAEIQRVQTSSEEHRSDKLMLIQVVQENSKVTQELSGVIKGSLAEQRETRRDIAELRNDLAVHMPKKNGARRQAVVSE